MDGNKGRYSEIVGIEAKKFDTWAIDAGAYRTHDECKLSVITIATGKVTTTVTNNQSELLGSDSMCLWKMFWLEKEECLTNTDARELVLQPGKRVDPGLGVEKYLKRVALEDRVA